MVQHELRVPARERWDPASREEECRHQHLEQRRGELDRARRNPADSPEAVRRGDRDDYGERAEFIAANIR